MSSTSIQFDGVMDKGAGEKKMRKGTRSCTQCTCSHQPSRPVIMAENHQVGAGKLVVSFDPMWQPPV